MKLSLNAFKEIAKHCIYIMGIYMMLALPAIQTVLLMMDDNAEIVELYEEDTDEEEKQEDTKDKKLEIRYLNPYPSLITEDNRLAYMLLDTMPEQVYQDVIIPPPDRF